MLDFLLFRQTIAPAILLLGLSVLAVPGDAFAEDALKKYGDKVIADQIRYRLAEFYYDAGKFEQAADHYVAVITNDSNEVIGQITAVGVLAALAGDEGRARE